MKSELDQYLEATFAHGYRNSPYANSAERVNAAYQFLADDVASRTREEVGCGEGIGTQLLFAALDQLTPTQWHTMAANLFNKKREG